MSIKNLTCIECPLGCSINVTIEENLIVSISGNSCKRGKIYAENEVVNPKRVLTTTVKTNNGNLIAVKTDNPIPKTMLFEFMKKISLITVNEPVKVYDVIIKNVLDGVNVVATDDLK